MLVRFSLVAAAAQLLSRLLARDSHEQPLSVDFCARVCGAPPCHHPPHQLLLLYMIYSPPPLHNPVGIEVLYPTYLVSASWFSMRVCTTNSSGRDKAHLFQAGRIEIRCSVCAAYCLHTTYATCMSDLQLFVHAVHEVYLTLNAKYKSTQSSREWEAFKARPGQHLKPSSTEKQITYRVGENKTLAGWDGWISILPRILATNWTMGDNSVSYSRGPVGFSRLGCYLEGE